MFNYVKYDAWEFDGFLTEKSQVLCPECEIYNFITDWGFGEVGCEDCGSHSALVCPSCNEKFDCVYSKEFKVINDYCPDCFGSGSMQTDGGGLIICRLCGGTGKKY